MTSKTKHPRSLLVIIGALAALGLIYAAWQQHLQTKPQQMAEAEKGKPATIMPNASTGTNVGNLTNRVKSEGVAPKSTATTVITTRVPLAGRRGWGQMSEEQKRWTAHARPTPKTSLRLLDLSKVPTEKDLRMAGQLGEELHPTAPANPNDIHDATDRARQEADNTAFGRAIQEWNLHNYEDAQDLFLNHLAKFPGSPWAAESELHLGCACQYLGKLDEAQQWFEASQSRADLGHPMHQKALLRLGVVAMDRGELEKATELFTKLRENEGESSRMTYASYWIRALSQMKAKETALRDCGQKSLGEICSMLGKDQEAKALRARKSSGSHGYTIQELEAVAREYQLDARTVRAGGDKLEQLPLPLVAHYRDNHFVAVLTWEPNGRLRVYDTRVGHSVEMDRESFVKQWSGLSVVFEDVKLEGVRMASVQETIEAMGGCCGLPRNPDDLCDDCCEDGGGGGCSSGSCGYGMPIWSVNPINMNLVVKDTPMWWDSPYGPSVAMSLTYNSVDSLIAIRPFGDKWMLSYSSYLVVDPSGSVKVIRSGGRGENFTPNGAGGYNPNARNAGKNLRKIAGSDYRFELEEADGTTYLYDVPSAMSGHSASSLLLSITDKYGTSLTITHNNEGAITAISHPAAATLLSPSGTWNFIYGENNKVDSIDDPFGRQATFTYDANDRLIGQTDMGEVSYGYSYTTAAQVREPDPNNPGQFVIRNDELFLNSIITPSGVTQFYTEPADGITNAMDRYPPSGADMWENYRITITDPMGQKEEYHFDGYSKLSWHRDKNHYKSGEQGAVKTVYHFSLVNGFGEIRQLNHQGGGATTYEDLTDGGSPGTTTGPDNHTDVYTYNDQGNVLTHVDGHGIKYSYEYATNGLDVVRAKREVDEVETVVMETEYDPVTRDVTAIEDESGLRTEYTRNTRGQLTSISGPNGRITTYGYNSEGYLEDVRLDVSGHPNQIVHSTNLYDDVGRVVSQMDSNGYMVLFEYDDLNRVIKTTYPDTTFTLNNYNCCNLISVTARDGKVSRYAYDALKRVTSVVNPGRETINYEYDKVGNLTKLRFGRGEWVQWVYDEGNRKIVKLYPDNKKLTYGYEAGTGRVAWTKDELGRQTSYGYDSHGHLTSLTHPELPSQTFTYNEIGQQISWTDGTAVTSYTYDSQGRKASIDGPLANDTITYTYNSFGKVSSWSYDGHAETYGFDALGRIISVTNPLGTFTFSHAGNTGVVTEVGYPVVGLKTKYSYGAVNNDSRLNDILHEGPGNVEIARFGYAHNTDGSIATWSQKQVGLIDGRQWVVQYDAATQMSGVLESPLVGTPPNPQTVFRYQYDGSGNRVLSQESYRTSVSTYNSLNQMTTLSVGGATWFRGAANENAQVTVGGKAAKVSSDGAFEGILNLGVGVHDVPIQATDKAGNVTNEMWRIDNGTEAVRGISYDERGNTKSDGIRSFSWDARNRMTSVAKGTDAWSFSYDGGNRRVSEVKNSNLVRQWVWNGNQVMEERAADGTKLRFWSGGVEILNSSGIQTGKRFLLEDHLGSPRVSLDESATIVASYDYTPWGKRSLLSGSEEISRGYTGHTWHESGLSLAVFRPYDPNLCRWLARDPIEERGGVNLYGRFRNQPFNFKDTLGLCDVSYYQNPDLTGHGWLESEYEGTTMSYHYQNGEYGAGNNSCGGGGTVANTINTVANLIDGMYGPGQYNTQGAQPKVEGVKVIKYKKSESKRRRLGSPASHRAPSGSKCCANASCADVIACLDKAFQEEGKKDYDIATHTCREVSKLAASKCCLDPE